MTGATWSRAEDPEGSRAEAVRSWYRRFAENECRDYSPHYARLCHAVVDDEGLVAFIAGMPEIQPNLFLAAVQYISGVEGLPRDGVELAAFVAAHRADVTALMHARRTQTNEVGRCGPLLTAMPPGPLALVEVGASAGLNLMLDRYRYDYGGGRELGDPGSRVRIRCRLRGSGVPTLHLPEVVWRRGLDLDPVDVREQARSRWLLACVWPEHVERRARLEAALAQCRRDPPRVDRGDLCDDLEAVLAEAPSDATLVVFHSAVLWYQTAERRQRFVELLAGWGRDRELVHVSSEDPGVIADVEVPPSEVDGLRVLLVRTRYGRGRPERRLLGVAHAHGAELEWLGDARG
ncbi:MAG: DUF2332 domain-containing protein [Planctomycetota bacterium]